MDFLHFNSQFQVLICTRCIYAIVPDELATQLKSFHKEEITLTERLACVKLWKNKPLQPAADVQRIQLPRDRPPAPELKISHDGISCRLCPELSTFVCSGKTRTPMLKHLRTTHACASNDKGRPLKEIVREETGLEAITTYPILYQTFHRSNFCRYFQAVCSVVTRL